jgi:ribosomal protein S18 acetylase RimI-like enzyme
MVFGLTLQSYRPSAMASLDIEPFGEGHLDAAAELLAERHARHREAEPLLPADVDFRGQIESEWQSEGASGVFASRGGEPVGYLVGFLNPRFGFRVGIGGHAVRGDAEVARDLYAAVAGTWRDAGSPHHDVFVPISETALVDAWFRLSFGAGAVLAMRATTVEPAVEAGVVIRPGTPDDVEAAALLDRELGVSLQPAPSFSSVDIESVEEYIAEWQGTWDDPQFTHFVAERDGRVVGHSLLYKRPADLRVPTDSIDLANAATFPDARGSGVGRALTAHVITWAHEHGYPTMVTDWRMTNVLASRFWPKRGFRPTFVRLYRNLS